MILASKRPSRGTDEKIRYLAKFHTRIVQNKIVLKWVIWTQFQMGGRGGGGGWTRQFSRVRVPGVVTRGEYWSFELIEVSKLFSQRDSTPLVK